MDSEEKVLSADEIQELNDYLYLDSARYDNGFGGEE